MTYEKHRCCECGKSLTPASQFVGKELEGYLSGKDRLMNLYSCMNEDCEYYNQKIEVTD